MKFKIEIDLGWIDEEYNIDDEIKTAITDHILQKIKTKEIEEKLKNKIESTFSNFVTERLNKLIDSTYNSFMGKEVSLTNKYGDIVKTASIDDIIKERFDNYFTEKVDSYGKAGGYGANTSRIDWIMQNKIDRFAESFTADTIKDIENRLKKHFSDVLQEKLTATIAKKLGLTKLLEGKIK